MSSTRVTCAAVRASVRASPISNVSCRPRSWGHTPAPPVAPVVSGSHVLWQQQQQQQQQHQHQRRWASGSPSEQAPNAVHFRISQQPHPLLAKPAQWGPGTTQAKTTETTETTTTEKTETTSTKTKAKAKAKELEKDEVPIVSLMQNHVWSRQEIEERMANLYQHRPKSTSDKLMHGLMYSLYRGFNWITGFQPTNTAVRAVEWRLIVLESFAGVPGFMAAMFRHFRSLRTLQRDHGWIHTLLEEAENERMHLLVCMKMFKANAVTRTLVQLAQVSMTPFLAAIYVVSPWSVHRFVGYLEETACLTYANIIHQVETPGTPLHEAWAQLPAPALARTYWKLPEEAMWVDALRCMFADECNHRDVNHTFATMESDDPNPFIEKHQQDAVHAWRLVEGGQTTDLGCHQTLGKRAERAERAEAEAETKTGGF